jgi:peptidoglycan hydrolase CwlO-like protein
MNKQPFSLTCLIPLFTLVLFPLMSLAQTANQELIRQERAIVPTRPILSSQTELLAAYRKVRDLNQEIQRLESVIGSYQTDLENLSDSLDDRSQTIRGLEDQIAESQNQRNQLQEEISSLNDQLSNSETDLRQLVDDLNFRLSAREEELSQRNFES